MCLENDIYCDSKSSFLEQLKLAHDIPKYSPVGFVTYPQILYLYIYFFFL